MSRTVPLFIELCAGLASVSGCLQHGTNRIAVACRRLPAEEARHAIGIEMEQRWLDAVRPSLVADYGAGLPRGQRGLFGGVTCS